MREPESTVTAAARRPGRLGRYELLAELASGGMGTVYLARTTGPGGFDKLVALKCIHRHLAKEREFVEMFLDEARIASRISHPNVCGVFDVGEADGTYYLAMEYLLGESVAQVLRVVAADAEQRYSARLQMYAARVIAEAAEGLHAAHELRGDDGASLEVVHRDVSPQNLFITYDGSVRVVDFGIARAAGRLHETSTGVLKGKLAYMAPEQLARLPIDRRADVWALGVTLWEIVTCRRLFRRESEVDTLFAVTTDAIASPASVREHIAPELDAIVMRALDRDRDKRYQTARELGRDLARFVARAEEPVGASELAEWMQALMPAELAQKRALLEEARAGTPSVPPSPATSGEWDPPAAQSATGAVPEVSKLSLVRPSARRIPWIGLMFVLLAGSGITALAMVLLGGPRGAGESPSPPVPAPAPVDTSAPRPGAGDSPVAPTQSPTPPVPIASGNTTPVIDDAPPIVSRPRTSRVRVEAPLTPAPTGAPVVPTTPVTPPPAPENGTVDVGTPGGWADIYEHGRRLGRSPTRVELPAGPHTLELRPFGATPGIEVAVDVPAGGRARISRPVTAGPSTP